MKHNRNISLSGVLILLSWIVFPLFANGQANKATEIIKKAEENALGKSQIAIVKISVIRPTWTKEFTMKTWAKGHDFGMISIQSPARDAGVGYLKIKNEAWNWQPAIERNIKLPPSMMSQSWMGSDVSNDDLIKHSSLVVDYSHKQLKDTIINNYDCYKIELEPKQGAAVVWGRVIICVDKKNYIKMQVEYFDEKNILIRTLIAHDILKYGNRYHPQMIECIPVNKDKHKTTMFYEEIYFDTQIEDQFFSIRNMKNLK